MICFPSQNLYTFANNIFKVSSTCRKALVQVSSEENCSLIETSPILSFDILDLSISLNRAEEEIHIRERQTETRFALYGYVHQLFHAVQQSNHG